MILAAGLGTRMQKGGEQTPKPLVSVCGRPLIHYPLLLLARAGFQKVIINLHHRPEEIKKQLGEQIFGMKIHYIYEPEILGTGGGVKNADQHFPAAAWLIINSDTIADLELRQLISFQEKNKPLATMVLTKTGAGKFNPVFADAQGRVRGIGREADSAGLSAHNFCGVQLIRRELLDYLPDGFSKMIEDGYRKALAKDQQILAYIFSGLWLAIDTPGARVEAEREMSECKSKFFDKNDA